jgi:hypothetical protein
MAPIDLIPSHDSMGNLAGYAITGGRPLPFRNDEEVRNILRSRNTPEVLIQQALEKVNASQIVTISNDGVFSVKINPEVVGQ